MHYYFAARKVESVDMKKIMNLEHIPKNGKGEYEDENHKLYCKYLNFVLKIGGKLSGIK